MWEDLERRRPTEIDELQGAVIARAAALGLPTPVNRAIAEAIRSPPRRPARAAQARSGDLLAAS
jgi:2-dehydropantoate 2-reductase